ncbi:MAG: 4'-phosphopantetheinyl transferase superfamily protein [Moraxellaceae bacterium]|nr:4'-phosphopantetheinyl transferase superfamily protein [Moraxellaceae bacterium]MDZ4385621.1 4'-phosphopantetheinyl transferase superfamily protein [Moraxellaceae bacterium]
MTNLLKAVASPKTVDGFWLFQQPESDIFVRVYNLPTPAAYHAILQQALIEILAQPSTTIDVIKTEHGKPYFANHDLAFNLSHSQQWLAVAWSTSQPSIGVDIEHADRQQQVLAISKRYFHANEQATAEKNWLHTWTRKEAVLKAHGLGLRIKLAELDTTTETVEHSQLGRWAVSTAVHPSFVLSVSWPALQ